MNFVYIKLSVPAKKISFFSSQTPFQLTGIHSIDTHAFLHFEKEGFVALPESLLSIIFKRGNFCLEYPIFYLSLPFYVHAQMRS